MSVGVWADRGFEYSGRAYRTKLLASFVQVHMHYADRAYALHQDLFMHPENINININITRAPNRPTASLPEWAQVINGLAARASESSAVAQGEARPPAGRMGSGVSRSRSRGRTPLLTRGAGFDGGARDFAAISYHMAPEVAEHLVAGGLNPDFLNDLATASGLPTRDVLEFAGIDRTTVSRRQSSGASLPQEAAVKALQVTDLVTQAAAVFGSPAVASAWLTKEHPLLNGQTPLQRARTPWGMGKVLSMLVALRYGGAA